MRINISFAAGFVSALILAAGSEYPAQIAAAAEPVASRTDGHFFVRRATAETLEPSPNSISRIMLTADQTNGRFSVIDEIFKPGMKSPPHTHSYHSETFIVLEGKMQWTVGGETQVIGPGDLVYIPPDTAHQTEVIGEQAVHALMLYEPGGYEFGLRRRTSTPREKMQDPEFRRQMMDLSDVKPLSPRRED